MEFSMIENSLDSLSEAIDYYKSGKKYSDERCFKFAVLLLSHCAELLLKEILYREHEMFIYEDIDKPVTSSSMTVGFKKAQERIKNITNINLGRYNEYLTELAKVRNKIQHYHISIPQEQCTSIIISSFSAIQHIVHTILNKTFDDFDEVITQEQIDYLHEDKEVYKKRKADVRKDIKENKLEMIGIEYDNKKYINYPCPKCTEVTLVSNEDAINCKFCNAEYDSIEDVLDKDDNNVIAPYMLREIGRRKHLIHSIYECEKFNNQTLIIRPFGDYRDYVCLTCGNKVGIINCDDCGDDLPDSTYNYTLAQSYYDADNFKYLCKECGKKLSNSEYGCEFEIS